MKTSPFALAAATALFVVPISPLGAQDAPAAVAEPAAEPAAPADPEPAAAAETITLSIVVAKGGGWGISGRVRAALQSQPGVKTILLSGLRATVVMEDGQSLDEEKLKEALKAKKVQFVSLETSEVPVPKAAYVLQAAGTSWSATNDKARAALEALDGVSAAFVNNGITLLLDHEDPLDEAAVQAALDPLKIRVSKVEKAEQLPF